MNSLTAALEYYDQGWLPMPLQPSSKLPALERWRHYQYPSQRPTRDEILDWFTARPDANVAILTGRASGLVVVDFDLQGVDTAPTPMDWPAWCRTHDLPIPERAVLTGGGGLHGYYLHPGLEVSNAVRLLKVEGVGVDIRADGGYVVAPPSRHENGQRYAWLGPPTLPTETIPDVYLKLLKDKPALNNGDDPRRLPEATQRQACLE